MLHHLQSKRQTKSLAGTSAMPVLTQTALSENKGNRRNYDTQDANQALVSKAAISEANEALSQIKQNQALQQLSI